MQANIIKRLRTYFEEVGSVLRGEAKASSIFANAADIGTDREKLYVKFLQHHCPSKCSVFLGGSVFDDDGAESKQMDVIITTDTTPRYNLSSNDAYAKSLSPIEGTLGVASIKSHLTKKELYDALDGIASIPSTKPLDGRVLPGIQIPGYEDWPFKIIYASSGIKSQTLADHLFSYYSDKPSIPFHKRPHLIHVSGQCAIFRVVPGLEIDSISSEDEDGLSLGSFHLLMRDPDIQAIVWTLCALQERATASGHILYSYLDLINKIITYS